MTDSLQAGAGRMVGGRAGRGRPASLGEEGARAVGRRAVVSGGLGAAAARAGAGVGGTQAENRGNRGGVYGGEDGVDQVGVGVVDVGALVGCESCPRLQGAAGELL